MNETATIQASPAAETASSTAVSVNSLVKRYDQVEAVRGIELEVASGEIFGFLGPTARASPRRSTCCARSCARAAARRAWRGTTSSANATTCGGIGLVFQDTTLDGYLSAEQNLQLHAELYGVPRGAGGRAHAPGDGDGGAVGRRDSLVDTFSGGMKRRLEIARGLLHSPRVLFLDEPTVGLDPQTRSSIWRYIRELKAREDIAIFLTTHYMDEAEYCDRIAIMDRAASSCSTLPRR